MEPKRRPRVSSNPERVSIEDREDLDGSRLEMRCPRCGTSGRVKLKRLSRTLQCRGCKTVLHIDQHGAVREGARSKELLAATAPDAFVRHESGETNPWKELSRATRRRIIGGACGALGVVLLMILASYIQRVSIDVPDSLMGRSEFLGDALATGDRDRFVMIAESGTRKSAGTLFDDLTKSLGLDESPRPQVSTQLKPAFESTKTGKAGVGAVFRATLPEQIGAKPLEKQVVLYWTRHDNVWQFDGTRTLETYRTVDR